MTMTWASPTRLGFAVLSVLLISWIPLSQAAPVHDSTEVQPFEESMGCYYNYAHYTEGDRILTNEPCLNCTCHNRMLMCYLRVCPFTKPIGQDCVVEKREDQCCPIITCPEVPVELLDHSSQSTELSADRFGCSIDGKYYSEGAQVPSHPKKPCELCYCIRNMTSCVMQECTLHVDGCRPIYNRGVCCPVRYDCDHTQEEPLQLEDMTTTTERPTPGFLLTTTMSPSVSSDCYNNGEVFADGALIITEAACEHCYCMRGDMVCAVQECGTPLENEGKNCTARPPRDGECCPDVYDCDVDGVSVTHIPEIGSHSMDEEQKPLSVTEGEIHSEIITKKPALADVGTTVVPESQDEHIDETENEIHDDHTPVIEAGQSDNEKKKVVPSVQASIPSVSEGVSSDKSDEVKTDAPSTLDVTTMQPIEKEDELLQEHITTDEITTMRQPGEAKLPISGAVDINGEGEIHDDSLDKKTPSAFTTEQPSDLAHTVMSVGIKDDQAIESTTLTFEGKPSVGSMADVDVITRITTEQSVVLEQELTTEKEVPASEDTIIKEDKPTSIDMHSAVDSTTLASDDKSEDKIATTASTNDVVSDKDDTTTDLAETSEFDSEHKHDSATEMPGTSASDSEHKDDNVTSMPAGSEIDSEHKDDNATEKPATSEFESDSEHQDDSATPMPGTSAFDTQHEDDITTAVPSTSESDSEDKDDSVKEKPVTSDVDSQHEDDSTTAVPSTSESDSEHKDDSATEMPASSDSDSEHKDDSATGITATSESDSKHKIDSATTPATSDSEHKDDSVTPLAGTSASDSQNEDDSATTMPATSESDSDSDHKDGSSTPLPGISASDIEQGEDGTTAMPVTSVFESDSDHKDDSDTDMPGTPASDSQHKDDSSTELPESFKPDSQHKDESANELPGTPASDTQDEDDSVTAIPGTSLSESEHKDHVSTELPAVSESDSEHKVDIVTELPETSDSSQHKDDSTTELPGTPVSFVPDSQHKDDSATELPSISEHTDDSVTAKPESSDSDSEHKDENATTISASSDSDYQHKVEGTTELPGSSQPDSQHKDESFTELPGSFQPDSQHKDETITVVPGLSGSDAQHEDDVTTTVATDTVGEQLDENVYVSTDKDDQSVNDKQQPIDHSPAMPALIPASIPGEGSCLQESITYDNYATVPTTKQCQRCSCDNSIIKCETISDCVAISTEKDDSENVKPVDVVSGDVTTMPSVNLVTEIADSDTTETPHKEETGDGDKPKPTEFHGAETDKAEATTMTSLIGQEDSDIVSDSQKPHTIEKETGTTETTSSSSVNAEEPTRIGIETTSDEKESKPTLDEEISMTTVQADDEFTKDSVATENINKINPLDVATSSPVSHEIIETVTNLSDKTELLGDVTTLSSIENDKSEVPVDMTTLLSISPTHQLTDTSEGSPPPSDFTTLPPSSLQNNEESIDENEQSGDSPLTSVSEQHQPTETPEKQTTLSAESNASNIESETTTQNAETLTEEEKPIRAGEIPAAKPTDSDKTTSESMEPITDSSANELITPESVTTLATPQKDSETDVVSEEVLPTEQPSSSHSETESDKDSMEPLNLVTLKPFDDESQTTVSSEDSGDQTTGVSEQSGDDVQEGSGFNIIPTHKPIDNVKETEESEEKPDSDTEINKTDASSTEIPLLIPSVQSIKPSKPLLTETEEPSTIIDGNQESVTAVADKESDMVTDVSVVSENGEETAIDGDDSNDSDSIENPTTVDNSEISVTPTTSVPEVSKIEENLAIDANEKPSTASEGTDIIGAVTEKEDVATVEEIKPFDDVEVHSTTEADDLTKDADISADKKTPATIEVITTETPVSADDEQVPTKTSTNLETTIAPVEETKPEHVEVVTSVEEKVTEYPDTLNMMTEKPLEVTSIEEKPEHDVVGTTEVTTSADEDPTPTKTSTNLETNVDSEEDIKPVTSIDSSEKVTEQPDTSNAITPAEDSNASNDLNNIPSGDDKIDDEKIATTASPSADETTLKPMLNEASTTQSAIKPASDVDMSESDKTETVTVNNAEEVVTEKDMSVESNATDAPGSDSSVTTESSEKIENEKDIHNKFGDQNDPESVIIEKDEPAIVTEQTLLSEAKPIDSDKNEHVTDKPDDDLVDSTTLSSSQSEESIDNESDEKVESTTTYKETSSFVPSAVDDIPHDPIDSSDKNQEMSTLAPASDETETANKHEQRIPDIISGTVTDHKDESPIVIDADSVTDAPENSEDSQTTDKFDEGAKVPTDEHKTDEVETTTLAEDTESAKPTEKETVKPTGEEPIKTADESSSKPTDDELEKPTEETPVKSEDEDTDKSTETESDEQAKPTEEAPKDSEKPTLGEIVPSLPVTESDSESEFTPTTQASISLDETPEQKPTDSSIAVSAVDTEDYSDKTTLAPSVAISHGNEEPTDEEHITESNMDEKPITEIHSEQKPIINETESLAAEDSHTTQIPSVILDDKNTSELTPTELEVTQAPTSPSAVPTEMVPIDTDDDDKTHLTDTMDEKPEEEIHQKPGSNSQPPSPAGSYDQQQSTYGQMPSHYPSPTYPDDDYSDEEDPTAFGPGTCRYGGKLYVSAQQIPRDDPCDFCFCFRSDIICLQQSCPPPISGCHEEPISGFCCPRYECPVAKATVLNVTTSTTTTTTTLPPHFLHHAYKGAAQRSGCQIQGQSYQVGDVIKSTSGPCMHCTCGGDGQMKCDPKVCTPEPMLRQMIAAAGVKRR